MGKLPGGSQFLGSTSYRPVTNPTEYGILGNFDQSEARKQGEITLVEIGDPSPKIPYSIIQHFSF